MANSDQETGGENVTVRLIKKIADMSEAQQSSLLKQLEEMSATDQFSSERDGIRKNFKETVQFVLKARTYTGTSQDISAGGMFIKTGDEFKVGQTITITIPLSKKQKHIKVPAQIVRIEPEGIGVEFLKRIE